MDILLVLNCVENVELPCEAKRACVDKTALDTDVGCSFHLIALAQLFGIRRPPLQRFHVHRYSTRRH